MRYAKSALVVGLLSLAALLPGSGRIAAQDVETKTSKIGAAKTLEKVHLAMAAVPQPNATAFFNLRQARLRDHHRKAPLGRISVADAPKPPPLPKPTSVASLLAPHVPGTVTLLRNKALPDASTNDTTSTVCEPSVATRGKEVLLTGNWFAAFSKDGGNSFEFRNPYNVFPKATQGSFCCDQVVIYDPVNDLMCWLLQYVNDESGNTLRLAVAKGSDITNENWRYYDFTPQNVGGWQKEWFDFPDLVLGKDNLYLSSNAFTTDPENVAFTRCVMLRLPLAKLAAYSAFDYQYFSASDVFSLRATHGARGDAMYFAAHVDQAKLRVFSWKESSASLQQNDVAVERWSFETASAAGPDGRDWLGRADGRLTAAWLSGDTLGFAWTAPQEAPRFKFPQVRVALVNKTTKMIIAQPHIWNPDFAFAYPAAAPNADGRIGIALHYGGGSIYPSHAVGVLVPGKPGTAPTWSLVATAGGTNGPSEGNLWGDYGAVRPHGQLPKTWVASGYTLNGGSARTNVVVRYIHFQLE